jgi:hypothetical protein
MQTEFIVFLALGVVAALIPSMDTPNNTQCECLQNNNPVNIHLRRVGDEILAIRFATVPVPPPPSISKENIKRYYLRGSY